MNNNFKIFDLFPTPVYTVYISKDKDLDINDFKFLDNHDRSVDTYVLNNLKYYNLKQEILNHINNFSYQLGYDCKDYKITQSWVNIKPKSNQHSPHNHSNSLLSGVFYPSNNPDNISPIKFHQSVKSSILPKYLPTEDVPNLNYLESVEFKVKPNLLILFPSYLIHSVNPNQIDQFRYSLAFNSVPLNGLGSEHDLTELKF